jgi:hypothetical protein
MFMSFFRLSSLAAAAITAAGSANALTLAQIDAARTAGTLQEVRIAGASALRLSVAAYIKEICNAGDFHVTWNSNADSTNHRAYSCTLASRVGNWNAGTPILVYKRDQGGSGQGVNPIALAADQTHMRIDAACTTINGGNTPATDAAIPNFICPNTETTGIKSDAGISDVEPALLQAGINIPTFPAPTPPVVPLTQAQLSGLDVAPLAQALFGVVVNKKTYRALQEAQGIIPPGGALVDVPADQATWTAATLATIPSLPTSFVRAMQNGQLLGGNANAAAKRGWNLVIPNAPYSLDGGASTRPAVDSTSVTKTLNICRRTEGSGTQATSNAFFATNPCNNSAQSFSTPLGVQFSSGNESTTSAVVQGVPLVVQEGTSAGQVENCVGVDAESAVGGDNNAYALGFLGRESNPQRGGTDRPYRFVKLDGIAPVRSEAQAGRYPIVFESTMQWNRTTVPSGSDKDAFLRAIRTGFGTPNALAAVDSDTQQGVMTPPAGYSGPWVDLTGNAAAFGSRVARTAGNSCAPLRIVK